MKSFYLDFSFRMKRVALRRRARHISVVLVVLVCATVGIWTWDTAPSSAFLPPQSRFLKLQTGLTLALKTLSLSRSSITFCVSGSLDAGNNACLFL